ncbi:hypothetical protein M9H77_33451 [Catharanthus roseus]|uniref:Uncharacterized protein n=1 Tax=Catharanthus roseus TaxID=4058 RepID=A0ACB9ZJL7_CATRO|nr:hypothetical protein M9H77_33451 [Catharanthus roseus]
MVGMEGPSSSRPPQISEMFQKFALAFKTKTYELFAEEEDDPTTTSSSASAAAAADADVFTLLDSAEEFIPDQKVVVIKPDPTRPPKISRTQFAETLISSLFATVSSFEASYLNFQTAHVPKINQNALESADKAVVSNLQKLTDLKNVYRDFRKNPCGNFELPVGSLLQFQVQENQNKLRALETMVNQLISDIERKDDQVLCLRKKLDQTLDSNSNLVKKLGIRNDNLNKGMEVLLTVRVFESILRDCVKSLHFFTKLLIDLMRKATWDLELAACSVFSDVHYAKKGHYKYAFLSYVCLGMFRGFDLDDFGLHPNRIVCNGSGSTSCSQECLKQLIEHVSCNPMEILANNPTCDFARFCEQKYEQLIHPTMESSMFSSFDGKELVLDSWKSLTSFYESFIRMASSVWLLHKLAYSFDPIVEIFQVERGVDFSMVYMEDVTRKNTLAAKTRPKVAFTVVPGFKVGRTIIQSQVYLVATNCTE